MEVKRERYLKKIISFMWDGQVKKYKKSENRFPILGFFAYLDSRRPKPIIRIRSMSLRSRISLERNRYPCRPQIPRSPRR